MRSADACQKTQTIQLFFPRVRGGLRLLPQPAFEQEGEEIRECVELAIETDVGSAQLDAVVDVSARFLI